MTDNIISNDLKEIIEQADELKKLTKEIKKQHAPLELTLTEKGYIDNDGKVWDAFDIVKRLQKNYYDNYINKE